MRGLARALTDDEASADDVAQETWLATLEHPPRTPPRANDAPRHWLAIVTRNVARRLTRKKRSDAALERFAAQREELPATDDVVVRAALQQRVVAAVMKQDEPYRSTLLQRFFDRMPPRAIAAAAHIPVETVKTRLKRGLELVRRELAGDFEREGRSWSAAVLMLRRFAKPAAGTTVVGSIGVVLMTKAVKLAIAAAVVAIAAPGAWWMWRGDGGGKASGPASVKSAAPQTVVALVVANAAEAVRAPESRTEATPSGTSSTAAVDPAAKGTFRGRVVDLTNQPVAGAIVYVGDQSKYEFKDREHFLGSMGGRLEKSYGSSDPPYVTHVESGADGTFECGGIDRFKTWSVGAGHRSAGCGLVSPVRFEPNELVRQVEIHLEGGISFVGSCTDAKGQPIRDAQIMISVKHDEPSLRRSRYADFVLEPDVHDDGTFTVVAIPFRYFTVQASAFDFEKVHGGYKEIRIPWTRIPEDQHEWPLDFKFERPEATTGRIVATDGTSAQLAIRLRPKLADAETMRQSRETAAVLALTSDPRRSLDVLRQVYANNGGMLTGSEYQYGEIDLDHDRYSIERLPPGARFIAIVVRNELLGVAEILSNGAGPDVPIDLALLPEEPLVRAVEFTAVSALDGKLLDNVQLDLRCYPSSSTGRRDVQSLMEPDEQRHHLPIVHELSLPIGTALIITYRYDCARDHLWAEIPPGDEPLELTVALTPTGKASIRGEVVDADGKPVADAVLRLYRKSDMKPVWEPGERMPGKSDAAGHFELLDLPATDYVVAAAPSNDDRTFEFASAVITIAAKESPAICRLVLRRGVQCAVDVSFIDGGRRGVRLRALSTDGLPLIDDFNHYCNDYWRGTGRIEMVLPSAPTTLEFLGPKGLMKSILFDPSRSTSASVILPAN